MRLPTRLGAAHWPPSEVEVVSLFADALPRAQFAYAIEVLDFWHAPSLWSVRIRFLPDKQM